MVIGCGDRTVFDSGFGIAPSGCFYASWPKWASLPFLDFPASLSGLHRLDVQNLSLASARNVCSTAEEENVDGWMQLWAVEGVVSLNKVISLQRMDL